jgi:hypothetical protein
MPKPLVITFPVFDSPRNMEGITGRVIGLRATPIHDAIDPTRTPEFVAVEGFHESGRLIEFTIPRLAWLNACSEQNAVTFIEVDDRRSKSVWIAGQAPKQERAEEEPAVVNFDSMLG